MKEIEWKVLSELMKNSRVSLNELARLVGVSASTSNRIIEKLESEGIIKEYTALPDFAKLGYQIMALTFTKYKKSILKKEILAGRKAAQESLKQVPEVIMAERGMGLGYDEVTITLHKDHAAYVNFMIWMKQWQFIDNSKTESFLIALRNSVGYKSLTLSTLPRHFLKASVKK